MTIRLYTHLSSGHYRTRELLTPLALPTAALRMATLLILAAFLAATAAEGQTFINEIFFNPGGDGKDAQDEYIEIRGESGAALTDHYLIILESENNGETGSIENIFDLGEHSLGSNGFLVMRQKFNRYGNLEPINPDATDLVNDGPNLPGPAFPGFGSGENSTIGASDLPSVAGGMGEGQLEGSGFTAMLIRNDSGDAPMLGDDLDDGDDGLDIETGKEGWTILDSVGFITELDELDGKLYGRANFIRADEFVLPETIDAIVPPNSSVEIVEYELEYLGRWGNSTGFTTDDWHATNLTDNRGSGSSGVVDNPGLENDSVDWRQSLIGNHPADDMDDATPAPPAAAVESTKNVPYGTKLANTLGGPNYITGDYNGNGVVDAADYTVWRDTVGTLGTELAHPAADHNHDFRVDQADYDIWRANFGAPFNTAPLAAATTIPEPQTLLIFTGLLVAGTLRRKR